MFRTTRGLGAGERLSASAVPFCVSVLINCEAAALRALLGDRASRKSRQQRHQNSRHQWKSEHQRLSHEVFTHRPFWRMHHSRRRRRPPPDTYYTCVCLPPSTTDTASSSSAVLLTDCYMCRRPNDVSCCWVQYISPPTHLPIRSSNRRAVLRERYSHMYGFFAAFVKACGRAKDARAGAPELSPGPRVTFAAERRASKNTSYTCTKAKCERSRQGRTERGCRSGFSTHDWSTSAICCIR
jgi:hypothetical protein